MSKIPEEDISLAAETLSDEQIVIALVETVAEMGMFTNNEVSKRFQEIGKRYKDKLKLRRKLEENKDLAQELIADYPLYASTSNLTYNEMIDVCVALNLDEE